MIVISDGDAMFAKFYKMLLKQISCFCHESVFVRSAVDSEWRATGPGPGRMSNGVPAARITNVN